MKFTVDGVGDSKERFVDGTGVVAYVTGASFLDRVDAKNRGRASGSDARPRGMGEGTRRGRAGLSSCWCADFFLAPIATPLLECFSSLLPFLSLTGDRKRKR